MVYSKEYYLKNKEKFLEWQRQYRAKHKEILKEKRRIYDKESRIKNREQYLKRRKELRILNKEKIMAYRRRPEVMERCRQRIKLKREKTNRAYDKQYYLKNKEKIALRQKKHAQIPEVKARRNLMARIRNRNNPRSNRSDSPEMQCHKNNVRAKMKQTCQWYGCGLTFREAPIHVHHIFPINEYPELEMEERYMILYCANHHSMFHRYRGDWYAEMINPNYQQNEFEPLLRNEDLD